MAKHREESGHTPKTALRESLLNSFRPRSESKTSRVSTRNKIAAAVVAAGAFAAVGQPLAANADKSPQSQAVRPVADQHVAAQQQLAASVNGAHGAPASVQLLDARPAQGAHQEAQKVAKGEEIAQQKAQAAADQKAAKEAADKEAAEKQAAEKKAAEAKPAASAQPAKASNGYVKPAEGTFTSGFGSRWGSTHKGIDIANSIGTPIVSVSGGEVISAGPASGFGQWVRVQHNDGTITVYGHVNTIDVSVGDKVSAGEKIATIGNKGQSTGPHLHFEVIEGGSKINPLPWLKEHGISVK
ncbi:M23 family metallopeptidase [Saccharopolyspora sp. NFXS83]|uniref:M23 family metallopeptidase n=1 Tax=Saccharopolyspora sp. NFXS83 TaxID=2993560 RepID=UPI00224B8241|nr:M23 family metallopeptidase [Saccharopolyspora sp. NFXS83]MCX2729938.1 M23 family metallopeptidase [Saccharopolyspora sp. NFXS83]